MNDDLKQLGAVLDYALNLSMSVRGRECSLAQEEASGFLHKQCVHTYSIWQILNPIYRSELTSLKHGAVFYDHSSLACLVRVMFALQYATWRWKWDSAPFSQTRCTDSPRSIFIAITME